MADEWIVRFEHALPAKSDQLNDWLPGDNSNLQLTALDGNRLAKLTAPDMDPMALHDWFRQSRNISYVEPNYVYQATVLTPDDTRYPQLWGLNNTGQSGGTIDADIDGPEAWELATGSSEVVIGVIDTGVDYTHPDLYLNMWINQDEIPSSIGSALSDMDGDGLFTFYDLNHSSNANHISDLNNNGFIDAGDLLIDQNWSDGADTDGNGFTDDFVGWDFVNNDNNPFDDNAHGTHVSGTIGGIGNNGTGVVGVNWNAQIMAIKFLNAHGSGSTFGAIQSVQYATAMGAQLTSNSWGGGGSSTALYNTIDASRNAGMLFIAAAGNAASNNDFSPSYPANYDLDNVISVAATDRHDNRASFSNYGAETVDLGAPGVSILSTTPNNGYSSFNGTSMATPHVAGVAALAWSTTPNATYQDIRDAIFSGVDPLPSMANITVTGGRLNAFTTLQNLNPHQGSIELDKDIYGLSNTIEVAVYDADLDVNPSLPDTTTIEISSTTETTPEVITLTETGASTSQFTGFITLALGEHITDGILQVANGDTITATYQDAENGAGPATLIDTAIADTAAPVISLVSASSHATRATISWGTDESSDSLVFYGTDPTNLDLSQSIPALTTAHSVSLIDLTPQTTYYFSIASTDVASNTSNSTGHSFTTQELSPILFVDDDEGDPLEAYFTNALDANGYAYDMWDSYVLGASPTVSELSSYSTVIWNTGYNYSAPTAGLTDTEQGNIADYLDGGGNIFLSGQDILYNGVSDDFISSYLHITDYWNDANVYRATGVTGDPIGDGMDLTLAVPSPYNFNYSDTLQLDSSASGIFLASETEVGGIFPYAASRYSSGSSTNPFNLVFFAFPFEAISTTDADPNNQNAVMQRVLSWLDLGGEPEPPISSVLDLDADDSSGITGANYATIFVQGDGPVAISDSDATLTDIDSENLTALTVTITTLLDETAEVLTADTTGTEITGEYDAATRVLALSGTDTFANYQQVLRSISYNNTSQNPNTDTRMITFVADDGNVLSNTATTRLNITGSNIAPQANAGGPYFLTAGDTLYLDAQMSHDPDEGPSQLTYKWDMNNDGDFDDALGSNPDISWRTLKRVFGYQTGETYSVAVKVSDGEDSSVAHAKVSVAKNIAPVADAGGPYFLTVGDRLYLNAQMSYDPDEGPSRLTYKWDMDNDGQFDDGRGQTPRYNWRWLERLYGYQAGETYSVAVKVSDGEDSSVARSKVSVAANMAPEADAGGPYFLTAGDLLHLDAQMSHDPDGGPSRLTYKWDIDNDGQFDDAKGSTPKISWRKLKRVFGYQSGETYSIAVKVSDGEDSSVARSKVSVAENIAPVADAGGPYFLTAGGRLYLDAQMSHDPDGGPSRLTYKWDMDNDGQFDDGRGRTPRYNWRWLERLYGYQAGETYSVAVKVSDGEDSSVARAKVSVAENVAPVSVARKPLFLRVGARIFLNKQMSFSDANESMPGISWRKLKNAFGYQKQQYILNLPLGARWRT